MFTTVKEFRQLFLAALCCASVVFSAEPKQRIVHITSPNHTWRVGDEVCLVNDLIPFACGRVSQTQVDDVYVRLTSLNRKERFSKGSRMNLVAAARRPSGEMDTFEVLSKKEAKFDGCISAGLGAGFTYFFPEVHAQWAPSEYLAVGALLMLAGSESSGTKVSIYGAMATTSLFIAGDPFAGLGFEVGGGFYSLRISDATETENLSFPAVQTSAIWNILLGSRISLGIKVGAQIFVKADSRLVDLGLTGVRPLGGLNFGWAF